MKTAMILTGAMRSFDKCLPALYWHVLRKFPGAHVYISTVKDADSPKADLLAQAHPEFTPKGIQVVESQPDRVAEMRAAGVALPEEWDANKRYTHEPYRISVHPQAVLRQLWQLEQGWKLMLANNETYDIVIRCRPDIFFQSLDDAKVVSTFTRTIYQNKICVPWWGRFGGMNDRFAIMGMFTARFYFQTHSFIPRLLAAGCPLHPESLIKAALETSDAEIVPLACEFSTMRNDGTERPPEISTFDLADLAIARR